MRQLAEWIVCALKRRKATSVSDHKVYVYGFEAALYTLFSTAGLILIGSLLGRHIESLIIIAFFLHQPDLRRRFPCFDALEVLPDNGDRFALLPGILFGAISFMRLSGFRRRQSLVNVFVPIGASSKQGIFAKQTRPIPHAFKNSASDSNRLFDWRCDMG